MPERPSLPAYLQIAADLRQRITSGELQPRAKLPSESALMRTYGVSNTVTKRAISVLRAEGLVEGRSGSGVYVREIRRLVRESHGRNLRRPGPTSPFARDAQAGGQAATWEHDTAEEQAAEAVAVRLAIEPGDPVMRTTYRYLADGHPVQLATSWEPLAITRGTPVERPEDGAAVGVVARMDHIGVRIDEFEERPSWRAGTPEEVAALGLSPRRPMVVVIQRTYYAAGRPVETADIVADADRYELVYRMPVD